PPPSHTSPLRLHDALPILTVIPISNQIAHGGYQSAFLTWGLIQGAVVVVCGFLLRAPRPGETPTVVPRAVPQAAKDSTPTEMLRSEEHTSELQSRFDLVCR